MSNEMNMSQPSPGAPWVHIGECPFCVDGLCRIRVCDHTGTSHLYAMCDECEAMWIEPTTESAKQFPDAEQPCCPRCPGPLFGPRSRWAEPQDLVDAVWQSAAIVDFPSETDAAAVEDFLTTDDIAGELDAPPLDYATSPSSPLASTHVPTTTVDAALAAEPDSPSSSDATFGAAYRDDHAYGDDEPRPGC